MVRGKREKGQITLTFDAAPPCITALIKIPRSLIMPALVVVFPLTLIPRPAEPVSLRGMFSI